MRAAVIGVGSLGQHHARLYATMPGAQLVAVVDRDPARAALIAARHGVTALTDLSDLPRELDCVSVAVPTSDHVPVSRLCLDRGLAVLVEKPMAPTPDEAEELVDRARRTGSLLCVGHTERFNPVVRAAATRISRPRFIEAHRLGVFSARSTDIDVVHDLMIHDLDVILSLVRSPVAQVDAAGAGALTDTVDIANARLRFEDGCVANVTASRISAEQVRKLRVFQRDAYVSIDYARQEAVACTLKRDASGKVEIVREEVAVAAEEPLLVELRAFLDRVRGGDAPAVTAEEGLAALQIASRIAAQIARQR